MHSFVTNKMLYTNNKEDNLNFDVNFCFKEE